MLLGLVLDLVDTFNLFLACYFYDGLVRFRLDYFHFGLLPRDFFFQRFLLFLVPLEEVAIG